MGNPVVSKAKLSPKAKDLTGQRFGKLYVVGFSHYITYPEGPKPEQRTAMWNTKCDCGTTRAVRGAALTTKTKPIRSCGCSRSVRIPNQAEQTRIMSAYRRRAQVKGFAFRFSRKTFVELIEQDCHYCGASPSNTQRYPDGEQRKDVYKYNGLDRIDSSKGYYKENVVPCCKRCNIAKNDMPLTEFVDLVYTICAHMKGRKDAR